MDDYAYFRDRQDPETIPYLEAENEYTEAMTAHTAELQQKLYDEMLGRIKEDDAQVPVPRDGWFYYTRTEKGKAYPIFARKQGSLERAGGDLLRPERGGRGARVLRPRRDGGEPRPPDARRARGHQRLRGLRAAREGPAERASGSPIAIEKLSWGLAWASDNRTVFYMTPDSAKRGDRVWRHTLGAAEQRGRLASITTPTCSSTWACSARGAGSGSSSRAGRSPRASGT